MIYQAVLTKWQNPPDLQIIFFSSDTDVLALIIANYDLMLNNTSISMVSEVVEIEPKWMAIGEERALPAFYAFTGTDNTGGFSGIDKAT